MDKFHAFKVGDVVNVFRAYPFNTDGTANRENKRALEGTALIISLRPYKDVYMVQFKSRGKFEGRKYSRYIDSDQETGVLE